MCGQLLLVTGAIKDGFTNYLLTLAYDPGSVQSVKLRS